MHVKPIFLLNTPQVSPKCTCADDVYLQADFWQKVIWFGSTLNTVRLHYAIPRRTQGEARILRQGSKKRYKSETDFSLNNIGVTEWKGVN